MANLWPKLHTCHYTTVCAASIGDISALIGWKETGDTKKDSHWTSRTYKVILFFFSHDEKFTNTAK